MSKPSDVKFDENTTAGLSGVFGLTEYEQLAHTIIDWLIRNGDSWETYFALNVIAPDQPATFAAFGTAGWLTNNYFPKSFMVSEDFIERLEKKGKLPPTHTKKSPEHKVGKD